LQSYGNTIIPVNNGELASGLHGEGRMAEPEEIVTFLEQVLQPTIPTKLTGKKVLITAGPTYEALDPVRFIGNHSSGKMGIELAMAARKMGADVQLILGPSKLSVPDDIKVTHVFSAAQMYAACKPHFAKSDVCIFAAAVADYTPKNVAAQKIKKSDAEFSIVLKKNVDIAAEFGKIKKKKQLSIGFALETNNELAHAQAKLQKKNFDLIVLNSLNDKGAGFQFNTNKITTVDRNNKITKFGLKSKTAVADDIIHAIETLL
ncbi:MAG TPA: bifunctional phosphopantothenoylcysteine decarboxylase/phosphopantothenate--cysteine ligase CoaBC, partial [Chitinophagales bacterium]|nr:bifunctional phosphopantothenoylcysteine decarboxylase/phosphopantothenate--cysteine ligase CoaBC [Chitinophagales bacterium]